MNIQEKKQSVAELSVKFKNSQAAYLVEYKGCTCSELTSLRRELRASGADFAVVKNTLARKASSDTGAKVLADLFKGPIAVIWANKDPVLPAKIVTNFAKAKECFIVKGGSFEGQVLSPQDVEAMSKLPSKEELWAKLLSLINAPAIALLRTINAPASSLLRVLEAWRAELEKKQ